MTDHPILFSGEMVRAILDGRKTQTRRILGDGHWPAAITKYKPGDQLWVRETWTARMTHGWTIAHARSGMYQNELIYAADGAESIDGWWPSIHMPREFSRLTLTVQDVRVQRLQDISEDDAIAEGCPAQNGEDGLDPRGWFRDLWDSLNVKRGSDWNAFGWNANPWVSALTFEPALCNIDQEAGA